MIHDVEALLDIGIALTKEKDGDRLLETILDAAVDITGCDGGTLYVTDGDFLRFKLLVNKSLDIRQGYDGGEIDLPPIPLSGANDCARAAVSKTPINVADVYADMENDYSGAKKYDALMRYRTTSMLTVPMENDRSDVIGVMQLVNAKSGGSTIPFAPERERIVYALASQAAICLTNQTYANEVTNLLDSFVRVMSAAIDERSRYNANHTRNMARYAERFTAWLDASGMMPFDGARQKQLLMSVWLHDVGKMVVPLEIMDKQTRLGPKIDRIRDRYLLFSMQNKIDRLSGVIDEETYRQRKTELGYAGELVESANEAEYLPDGELAKIQALAQASACGPDGAVPFLTPDELECLQIRKGTLTDKERRIMESHADLTRRLLTEMDFPGQFRIIPDWASSNHEYLNGKGYPDGKAGDEISPEARILTILDIYDALTAADRPYKPALTADKAFMILEDMAEQGQIDTRLLQLFKQSEAWRDDGEP